MNDQRRHEAQPCCSELPTIVSDENGVITDSGSAGDTAIRPGPNLNLTSPCSLDALNGSWLLTIGSSSPIVAPRSETRGPMRIEANASTLRVSGDIYVRDLIGPIVQFRPRPIPADEAEDNVVFPGTQPSYPAFPQSQYRWYFRSLGVTYSGGVLSFNFERHLWSALAQEFIAQDTGSLRLTCRQSIVVAPLRPLQMSGTLTVGGRTSAVTAAKTSPFFRGCLVEVDVMRNRSFPASATSCAGAVLTFLGVYQAAGLDFQAVVNETSLPEDAALSVPELNALLASHRSLAAPTDGWRIWLLVGSSLDGDGGTLGLMFDTASPPHREGAVGFFDPALPDRSEVDVAARGARVGTVPLAFLRTLLHEAGHTFNLFHPKSDVHSPPIGTTIMNQTGDVISFATSANPYPCNATMGFDNHNRTSLIHSPDPQVKPGWKEFGWGHGQVFAGIAEPVDAFGLRSAEIVPGLRLDFALPSEAIRGEFVFATVSVTNTSDVPQAVPTKLNLSEGSLWLTGTSPSGKLMEVRDVVLTCGPGRFVTLEPGESLSGQIQLFYTSGGFTFDQPGVYTLQAELDVAEVPGSLIRSEPARIVIRSAASAEERQVDRLSMHHGVGMALAIGDYGTDVEARARLDALGDLMSQSDMGTASAMIVANSMARPLRDPMTGRVLRPADGAEAARALDRALQGRDAMTSARIAAAVVSPVDKAAPLIGLVRARIEGGAMGAGDQSVAASKILADHLA